jgi:hypothetical protein
MAANLGVLILQVRNPLSQILGSFLDQIRFGIFRQHEQQDNGTKSAADAVQEGEAEYLNLAAARFHGAFLMANLAKDSKMNRL